MNITPSRMGYEHLMVFLAIQGAKEGLITSEYSGSVRLIDYTADEAFIKKCIAAWSLYAVSTFDQPYMTELLFTAPTPASTDVDEIFADMLAKGYLTYDTQHNVYEFSALNRVFGYTITSEANIPDWGILAWGVDGLGATYSSSDVNGIVMDPGVTYEEYLAQFPQHGVTGSDIIITYSGANALNRMLNGWDPRLKDVVSAIRGHIPVVLPEPIP